MHLTLKEYELLRRLIKNPNIVLTRDQLLEDIWGYDFDGETQYGRCACDERSDRNWVNMAKR